MKINELIHELNKIQDEHGKDLVCKIHLWDSGYFVEELSVAPAMTEDGDMTDEEYLFIHGNE